MTSTFNFTKKALDALALPVSGRVTYRDDGGRDSVKGLGLRVTANGVKSFVVERWVAGKQIRVTLGKYPGMTIATARGLAVEELGKLHHGVNPNVVKKQEKVKGVTLAEATAEYVAGRALKATTVDDIRRAFDQVIPDWRAKPLNRITASMVEKRHRDHAPRSMARANLAMRYLRAVFNFAIAKYQDDSGRSLIEGNPVKRLSDMKVWHRVDRRKTVIGRESLGAWMNAVLSLESASHRDYYLFVLMTGCRRNEAMGLRWDAVNLKARTVTFCDTKNHTDHVLPLSDYLVDMLVRRDAERLSRNDGSPLVFVDHLGRQVSNLRNSQATVTRACGVSFCPHDLRRTFATVAESLDIPGYALKRLLNHADGADVTSGYLIITTERLREPMEKISAYMLKSAGLLPSAEVIELAGHRGVPVG